MHTISAEEANNRFSELLALAESGEAVTITRDGRAVARMVPIAPAKKMSATDAIAGLRKFRKGRTLGGISIKELINEGRKW